MAAASRAFVALAACGNRVKKGLIFLPIGVWLEIAAFFGLILHG